MLVPFLVFNGNAAEAMRYYRSIFSGELAMQTFKDLKMAETGTAESLIAHAVLRNDLFTLHASDGRPDQPVQIGANVRLMLVSQDETHFKEYFAALSVEGAIDMPLEKQFWGDLYGQVTDKFGIHWIIDIPRPTG